MRTILILVDTLRRDALSCYNNNCDTITPNFDKFANESTVFNQHWVGSAPCMPARRDIMTGRLNFLERSWGPIEAFDKTMPEILKEYGVFSHITTDHCHYMRLGGEGYLQLFNTRDYVRGQEGDPYISSIDDPINMPETYYGRVRRQYQLNRQTWHNDASKYPSPKTYQNGIDWLEKNGKNDNYFLMVETFDPHEPFDVPKKYLDMYPEEKIDRQYFEIPEYGENNYNEEQLAYLTKRYKALLTMTDDYFGKLINKLKDLGIFEGSLIILTTDHGFFLGEHGYIGKNVMPMYNELSHLPLIVHFPENELKGKEVNEITQNIDIMPTVLDYFDISTPDDVKGKSWRRLADNKFDKDYALFGYHGLQMNVTDGRYVYLKAPNKLNKPLFEYTTSLSGIRGYLGKGKEDIIETGNFIKRSKYPVYKIPVDLPKQIQSEKSGLSLINKSYIFNIINDYEQRNNLISNESLETKMKKLMVRAMKENDSPEEQYERFNLFN
ncbi:MAG: sulfatase [Peptoniphilaceae bacterium]|nr:sulfatase [Peptoniphilaceae bacterium]